MGETVHPHYSIHGIRPPLDSRSACPITYSLAVPSGSNCRYVSFTNCSLVHLRWLEHSYIFILFVFVFIVRVHRCYSTSLLPHFFHLGLQDVFFFSVDYCVPQGTEPHVALLVCTTCDCCVVVNVEHSTIVQTYCIYCYCYTLAKHIKVDER
jgi:hypothetical protein